MDTEHAAFSSKDLQAATGLSYRQVNDWDARGALPNSRSSDRSWRRYSARDLFAVMVLVALRDRFGVPVSRLAFVRGLMLQDDVNHLSYAIEIMARMGADVVLLTDLEGTFLIDTDREIGELFRLGIFSAEDSHSFLLLKLSPLVNTLLESLGGEQIELDGRGYQAAARALEMTTARDIGEMRVLAEIRNREIDQLQVTLSGGRVRTIKSTSRPPSGDVSRAMDEFPHQKPTVVLRDGEVVPLEQRASERFENDD